MMKQFILTGMLLSVLGANAQNGGFSIEGQIEGIENQEVYLLLRTETGVDTLARSDVDGNAFELKGRLEEPALCLLYTGPQQGIQLFVENTAMTVSGKLPNIEVSGSRSHDELEKMSKLSPQLNDVQQKLAALSQTYREMAGSSD
ncbi:MAG TPA: DUF4369 domain-containing protein, partial [Anseongella sp.]|nr:DUF4369 domain-containing protein [Anseongella sp.]